MNKVKEHQVWKTDPVTQVVFQEMREIRKGLAFSLVNGATLKGGPGTAEETAKVVGILYGIDLFLELTFDEEDEDVEEPK